MGTCVEGGLASDLVGFIYLYAYVDNYDYNNYHCTQHIQSNNSDNPLIHLTFVDWEFEAGDSCPDWLSVYDGPDNSATLIGTFCGADAPELILSSGPDLFIEFQSDPDEESGFWIDWAFVGCGSDGCNNHGTCTNTQYVGGTAYCQCDDGFSGEHCEVGDDSECRCAVKLEDRQSCSVSYSGIPENECLEGADCCWEAKRHYPFCYRANDPVIPVPTEPESCLPRPNGGARHNCGWSGITRDQCLCQGCCYHRLWKYPWCYDVPA